VSRFAEAYRGLHRELSARRKAAASAGPGASDDDGDDGAWGERGAAKEEPPGICLDEFG
jgi:hypothetical protein